MFTCVPLPEQQRPFAASSCFQRPSHSTNVHLLLIVSKDGLEGKGARLPCPPSFLSLLSPPGKRARGHQSSSETIVMSAAWGWQVPQVKWCDGALEDCSVLKCMGKEKRKVGLSRASPERRWGNRWASTHLITVPVSSLALSELPLIGCL